MYNIRQVSPVSAEDVSLVSAEKESPVLTKYGPPPVLMTDESLVPAEDESTVSKKGVIEIKEKMFISQVNDVYLNPEDYLGKTIKLEGLFKIDHGYDKSYCFVLRYGPGCCGFDGNVGFEVSWDKGKKKLYPGEDSWVEATGELKTYKEDGIKEFLYLDLISLNVLDKRGAETVIQ
jgi:uncharacterized membrane protein YcgQ (UPF0703/DUF1980 family)